MYQKTTVVGHLGRDPEMRYTPSGVPVTSFTVATSRKWTNQNGEQQEKTTWFRVTCWRKLAEIAAQYLQKGKLVLVEGDIEAQAYTDKEGEARATLELTAITLRMLGGRGEGAEGNGGGESHAPQQSNSGAAPRPARPAASSAPPADTIYEDDIPF